MSTFNISYKRFTNTYITIQKTTAKHIAFPSLKFVKENYLMQKK